MKNFLKCFAKVIEFTKERDVTINRVLSVLDYLMHKFEIEVTKHESNSIMILFVDANYKKFQKY